ncbi:MAG: hypothetical protein ACXVHB_31695 [Solirubrobacteraceae bacterium]
MDLRRGHAHLRRDLSAYLHERWREELQEAGEACHREAADRAKLPTFKQFAKMAAVAANDWFGGDLTGVYGPRHQVEARSTHLRTSARSRSTPRVP